MGRGKVRLQFQCPAVAGDRLVELPLTLQSEAEVVVDLGKVRLQFQGAAVAGDRLVQFPLVLQRIAQVAVGLGIVRVQLQSAAVGGDCFVELPLVLEGDAQVVVESRRTALQPDCPSDALDGNLMPAHLVGNDTEKIATHRHDSAPARGSADRSARQLAAGRLDGAGWQSPMLRKSLS